MTDALCDDLRPELVGVVDALAALNAQRERERFVGLRKTVRAIVRHWRRIDGCGDSLDVVESRSRAIYSRDQRPAGDPRLRPHPASIPGVFPDYVARSFSGMPNGAREMAPAKDALWLQRPLPDNA